MPKTKLPAENVYEIREKTKQDVLKKLKRYHKCMIIRPTGFGKTYLLTDLLNNYRHVLYLYPAEVIADTVKDRYIANNIDAMDAETIQDILEMRTFANVDMMTYAKLVRLTEDELMAMDYDAIIVDEAHRVGANHTCHALSKLIAHLPGADIIGATATPNRTDSFDVVSTFFANVMSYPYTLHNAIQDGVLKAPKYCYCTYDIETDLKEAALTAGEDINNPEVIEVLNRKLIELSTIYNVENIVKEMCDSYAPNTSYMKFIVFFASMKHMNEKLPDVKTWFQSAYPDHTINIIRISSFSKNEARNVKLLQSIPENPNTITLIACIDMLNMGYHVNNLTGIVMYRSTKSDIIYVQQLGRALSSGANQAALVFDIVDNLHRKAVYDLTENPSKRTLQRMKKAKPIKTIWHIGKDDVVMDDYGHKAPFTLKENGVIVDTHGNPTNMFVNQETNEIFDTPNPEAWYFSANNITEEDVERIDLTHPLYANGKEATYRELLAKAVAEPMSQRCRTAVHIHFKHWCESNNVPYPISKKELDELENVSADDFTKYFNKIIRDNHIAYPLQDAKLLLAYGEDESDDIPLRICAQYKNVSVRAILNLLELAS